MKTAFRMILTLIIVGVISGGSLVCVYNYASPIIGENEERAFREEGLHKVLPEAVSYNEIKKEEISLYEGKDKKGNTVGYAFIAEGSGYQGKIKIIASIDPQLEKLLGMEVLESSETPGLGAEITMEHFKAQFRGLYVLPEITFTKSEIHKDEEVQAVTGASTMYNTIQAITGATISTRSVVEILNNEISLIRTSARPRGVHEVGE